MNINIIKATIITGRGADHVLLHTDIPDGCYPYKGTTCLEFKVAAGNGDFFLSQHFQNIKREIINLA